MKIVGRDNGLMDRLGLLICDVDGRSFGAFILVFRS